jgi:formylglycine-generating enzyme required for sulfatase activity
VGYRLEDSDPQPRGGPEAAWAEIEASVDPRDYADFLEAYPQSEQGFEARRRKRKLDDWAGTDQTDPAVVTAFLRSGAFAALQRLVQTTADNLAEAAERSRLLSVSPMSRSREARAAAVAGRAALARSFVVNLSGVANWPRPVMVAIPPGRFTMGSPDTEQRWDGYDGEEVPQHDVTIEHVFALGRGAVTLGAFAAFVADTNHDMGDSAYVLHGEKWVDTPGRGWRNPGFAQDDDHPVTCVSWDDAQAFIAWLNQRLTLTGRPDAYRLPSEAEWEYACRAGTQTPFSFGASLGAEQANFNGTAGYGDAQPSMVWRKATTPLGRFPANAFGLYDMHGDTWDWCEDAWNGSYEGAPADGSPWLTGDASMRVLRGGSWNGPPERCRSAMRRRSPPTARTYFMGFRLARTLSAG